MIFGSVRDVLWELQTRDVMTFGRSREWIWEWPKWLT